MSDGEVTYRVAGEADLPAITRVRTSVTENHLSIAQMAERGISNESVAASLRTDAKGWVAICGGEIVAFSIANRTTPSIFGLFVLPAFEGRGIGGHLLDLATQWIWTSGAERIWLETRQGTRAEAFYRSRGWIATGLDDKGSVHFELCRPG
ncbi:MAG: GNAT family N-acetyltransferase [Hyphomicrobiaceae bacterium]|nr:GNAT family N-acetyltransferase [Hyphomicrobiaceae bacterium]